MDQDEVTIDLEAYLSRIDYRGPRLPTADVLREVHLGHATHIPFENIDVLRGLPIRLDLDSLQRKLVTDRRGGYCFEQNMLLSAALEAIGFRLQRLLARVKFRSQHTLPLTHMALDVEAEGRHWLCDVGFGGHGLLEPIQFEEGIARQGIWDYHLKQTDARWWVLQAPLAEGLLDLYTLTREPYHLVDFEPPNYYVWSHPTSIFRQHLIAQKPGLAERHILVGRDYTVIRAGGATSRAIESDGELLEILAKQLGLVIEAGELPRLSTGNSS
jgi:N-hydroxyarylamine O-acetyltransferase